jgi:hypothetical protein
LQEGSGVLAVLKGLRVSEKYLNLDAKRKVKYNFSTRTMIPWNLKCEGKKLVDSKSTSNTRQ